ncbi:hypothetical protein BDQ17DRAFT_1343258 [Cyathus striatus]|nr:hypothetical protein BDQ17DRAFT_1343258 [Cyathus striatus]
MSLSECQEPLATEESESFFSNILTPGSSLHPTFLAVVDGAFALLFAVFIVLAFLTRGNIHIFALMAIEVALYGSVKWFIYELQHTQINGQNDGRGNQTEEPKKDQ